MQSHPFPEPESPELEPYLLSSAGEIDALLHRVAVARSPVTIYAGANGQFTVGSVFAIVEAARRVVLDLPQHEVAVMTKSKADSWVLVLFFEGVKIQFRCAPGREEPGGAPGLMSVAMPDQLLRLQRRETFRVKTPIASRPVCLIPVAEDETKYESLRVMNISLGGLAVMSYPKQLNLIVGTILRECYLDLPGIGPINVAIRVVNVYDASGNIDARRFGCQFIELMPQAHLMVQRYVNKIEAMQIKAIRDPSSW